MIKIMQISTDTNIGGAGIWLLTFLRHYNRDKLDVTVVIPQGSALKERIEKLGVRYTEADGIADCSFSLSGIAALRKIIAREKPQVVHTHASLSARIAAKLCKVPVVNTRHCIEPQKSGIKRAVYGFINRSLSDSAVAVSKAVYENLISDGIAEKNLALVYNGVTPLAEFSSEERAKVRAELGIENCIAVGIFARLEAVKNHELFLSAAAAALEKREDLRFVIVGTGTLEDTLKERAKELGIAEKVIFTGYAKDIAPYMNAIDINALTSFREALSISLVEGMTLSKACITTDAGGPSEVVENGVSGIVVPVNDTKELAQAVLLLAENEELRRKYGEAGKAIAKEKFSPLEMCEKLTAVYENLCRHRKEEK